MSDVPPGPTTTDAGISVESDEHSLTIGPDGPIAARRGLRVVGRRRPWVTLKLQSYFERG
jgi:hypothetical protein